MSGTEARLAGSLGTRTWEEKLRSEGALWCLSNEGQDLRAVMGIHRTRSPHEGTPELIRQAPPGVPPQPGGCFRGTHLSDPCSCLPPGNPKGSP